MVNGRLSSSGGWHGAGRLADGKVAQFQLGKSYL